MNFRKSFLFAVMVASVAMHAAVEIELFPVSPFIVDQVKRAAAAVGCGYIVTQDNLPLTITTPGKYSVAQDLLHTPTGDNTAAITVAAKNVTIEMNEHTLSQVNTGHAGVVGIKVNANLDDVVIRNGTIQNFSGVGISVQQGNSEVTLANLLTVSIGYKSGALAPAGIAINQSLTSEWDGSGNYIGSHAICEGIVLSNVSAESTFNLEGKAPVTGIAIVQSQNVVAEQCAVNQMVSNGFNLFGAVVATSTNVIFKNSSSSNHLALGLPIGTNGIAFGFAAQRGSRNITFEDCVAEGLRGQTGVIGFGINNDVQQFTVLNCVSHDNNVFNPGFAIIDGRYGFNAQNSASKGIFENCQAMRDQVGFIAQSASNDVTFKNCQAIGLSPEVTPTAKATIGFYASTSGVIIDSCVAENYRAFTTTPTLPGVAVQLDNAINCLVINCELRNCNFGILETGTSNKNLIKYNEIYQCTSGVEANITGSSLYMGNIGYLNTGTNFQSLPPGTPVRTWTLTSGNPPNNTDDFGMNPSGWIDNLNVR